MLRHIIQVNQNIVKVYDYIDIKKIQENTIYESLKSY